MSYYQGEHGTIYDLGNQIGTGGEGIVYTIQGSTDKIAKLYKHDKLTNHTIRDEKERKLKAMIGMNIDAEVDGIIRLAWPLDILYDQGQMVGFVMPKISNMLMIHDIQRFWRAESNNIGAKAVLPVYPNFTWKYSIQFAYNLAWVVNYVHSHGIVIGDFNPKNICIDTNTGAVVLIDCDSFDIPDKNTNKRFSCEVGFTEMLAPELQQVNGPLKGKFTIHSDNFALAIHIFRLLMKNEDPFGGIPSTAASSSAITNANENIINGNCPYVRICPLDVPTHAPDFSALPLSVQNLFKKTFDYDATTVLTKQSKRATALEWCNVLAPLGAPEPNPNLKYCTNTQNPLHKYHVYSAHNTTCPWCKLEGYVSPATAQAISTNSTSIPSSNNHQTNRRVKIATPQQKQHFKAYASKSHPKHRAYSPPIGKVTVKNSSISKTKSKKLTINTIIFLIFVAIFAFILSGYLVSKIKPSFVGYLYENGVIVGKDENQAYNWYKKSAEQGDSQGQVNLGRCYENGIGIETDENEAYRLYEKSAGQGDSLGQVNLGRCYEDGISVDIDENRAYNLYKNSANQGDSLGQFNLGRCYEYGIGVDIDYSQAYNWYKKSAEQGNSQGQFCLGWFYEYGIGVDIDYNQAYNWYKKSAEQGDSYGQYNLGYLYANGKGTNKNYSQAYNWYKKSAEQGSPYGQSALGWCYANGFGVDVDYNQAYNWYKKSAEQGDSYGQYGLGWCYANGFGIDVDYNQAYNWYRKSAEQKDSCGQYALGWCYEEGIGVDINYGIAYQFYRQSANRGNTRGKCCLGWCYEKGIGVDINYDLAYYWYLQSAEQNDSQGQNNLGVCYEIGLGIDTNYDQAFYWYKKSAEQGNSYGQNNLGWCYEKGIGVEKNDGQAYYWYKKSAERKNQEGQSNFDRFSNQVNWYTKLDAFFIEQIKTIQENRYSLI